MSRDRISNIIALNLLRERDNVHDTYADWYLEDAWCVATKLIINWRKNPFRIFSDDYFCQIRQFDKCQMFIWWHWFRSLVFRGNTLKKKKKSKCSIQRELTPGRPEGLMMECSWWPDFMFTFVHTVAWIWYIPSYLLYLQFCRYYYSD